MKVSKFILAQCAILGIAVGVEDIPPVPSFRYGITGEPTKVDTAFGNLGQLGPIYNISEAQNNLTGTGGGNSQFSTSYKPDTQTTEPTKMLATSTEAQTGKMENSNMASLPTVETNRGKVTATPEMGSMPNGTTNVTGLYGSTNPSQTFETTTVAKERTTTESAVGSGYNATNITNVPVASANPSPSPNSTSSASVSTPSTIPSSPSSTEGTSQPTTPAEPPSQTFHTGSPNSTATPTTDPGHNGTTRAPNTSTTSKPNSSLTLYPDHIFILLTSAIILYLSYESEV